MEAVKIFVKNVKKLKDIQGDIFMLSIQALN